MKREDAEEFTQSLGQIVGGSIRQIELADRLGVPKALGMELPEWVQKHLGGYSKLARDQRVKLIIDWKEKERLSNRQAAKRLGVHHDTVAEDLRSAGGNPPETGSDSQESGGNPPPAAKAAKTRTAHEQIAKAYFDQPATFIPGGDPVRLGDFYPLSREIPDASVDLIFTDPPYDDEALPLFGQMAEVAGRVLKPGGSLVTYIGHMQLFEAGRQLSQHLRFWHPLCCLHAGPQARMTEYGVIESFKPMLWYVKGTRADKQTFIESAISTPREKGDYDWQQSEAEAAYFISRLSPEGGLIIDFFAGSGTTILAARKLQRQAIGYERLERMYRVANDRIAEGIKCPA